jgi:hypothetical protein
MVFEFYTYSGFNIIVPVFQSIAILFNSDDYMHLFGIFAIAGVFLVSFFSTVRSLSGQPANPLKWVVPFLLSLAFFNGVILPKADVAVHDPVNNQSQTVGDVPLAIALVAGAFNLVERAVVDVIELATGSIYDEDAAGIAFSLIREASRRSLTANNSFLTKSLDEYIKRCGEIAISSEGGISDQILKRELDDLRDGLEAMAKPSWSTLVYDANHNNGQVVSCRVAWDDHLKTHLEDGDFDNMVRELCLAVGFDADALNQLAQCRDRMDRAMAFFGIASGTHNPSHFARNFYLAQRFAVAVRDTPDLSTLSLANRNALVQGVGMFTVASEWIPQIKAITTGIALSLIPILALLMVTPLAGKALIYLAGLFGWLTLWGTIDAILHGMSFEAAAAYLDNIAALGFGLDGIYQSGDASTQAIALFGKIRTFSIMLASALALPLFGFGSYSFSQMTEGLSQHLENMGSDAAMKTQTPEGMSKTLNQMTDAMSTLAMHSAYTPGAIAQSGFMNKNASVSASNALASQGWKDQQTPMDVSAGLGALQAGSQYGALNAARNMTAEQGGDSENATALFDTSEHISMSQNTLSNAQAVSNADAFSSDTGTLTSNMLDLTKTEALERQASAGVTQGLSEDIRQMTQGSERSSFEDLARFNRGATIASVTATQGDAHGYVRTLSGQQQIDLSRTDAMVQTGSQLSKSPQAMGAAEGIYRAADLVAKSEVTNETPAQQLADMHETESRTRVGSAQVKQAMVDALTADGVSEAKAYETVAQIEQTPTFSKLLATGGDANQYLSILANTESVDLGRRIALIDTALDLGISPEDVGTAMGKFEAASAAGQWEALRQMSPFEIALGFTANHLRHGAAAEQLAQVASEQGMDLKSFMQSSQGVEAAQTMAKMITTDAVARQFDDSTTEAILRQNGAQTLVSVSGDTAKEFAQTLRDNDLINEQQYDWMNNKADQGELIHASYAMDLTQSSEQAPLGNIQLRTGNQVSDSDFTEFNAGSRSTYGEQTNAIGALQAFTEINVDGGLQAIRDEVVKDFDDDGKLNGAGTIAAFSSLGQAVETFGQVRLTDFDRSSGSVVAGADLLAGLKVGFDSNKAIVGRAQSLLTGAGAEGWVSAQGKVGANLSGVTGSGEDFSASQFTQMAISHATDSLAAINGEMATLGYDLNATDPVARNDAEQFRDQRFVSAMKPFISDYIDQMREKGEHNMIDSDESNLLHSGLGKSLMEQVNDSADSDKFGKAESLMR